MSDFYYKSKLSIAKAFGVHRHTVDMWVTKEWFPAKEDEGWSKEKVAQAVEKRNAETEYDPGAGPGTKEEKTALECKRLKIVIEKELELLEQSKEETRRMVEEGRRKSRSLISKKEVEEGLTDFLSQLRSVIQSWAKSAQADLPEHHAVFDRAVKLYLDKVQEIGGEIVR
jgi:hypothetical protein